MPPQTLKRQADAVSFNNDDLDENDYTITCGNKRSRYLYTYNLQSPDLFQNINDSDQTESIQSKSTNELNFSSETNCEYDCDCGCQTSSEINHTDSEVKKNNQVLDINNGCLPGDNKNQVTPPGINLSSLSCFFKTCLLCRKENPNPYFQYCYKCFRFRMQLFESKPDPKPKSIKRLFKRVNSIEKSRSYKNSQESCMSNSQESGSFGISGLYLSQDNTTDMFDDTANSCNICFLKPKNGMFNHGKTSHVYCCYSCAKHIWSKSGKCPICNLKIRVVTKAITE